MGKRIPWNKGIHRPDSKRAIASRKRQEREKIEVKVKCPHCNHIWKTIAFVKNSSTGCPICGKHVRNPNFIPKGNNLKGKKLPEWWRLKLIRNPPIETVCEKCGRIFIQWPSQKHRFCSKKCGNSTKVGKPLSDATKKKQSKKLKGRIFGYKWKKGHPTYHDRTGEIHKPSTIAKMHDAGVARFKRPEYLKKFYRMPEQKAPISWIGDECECL